MERIHHRHGVGEFLGGGGLEPGEAVHRDHVDRVAPGLWPFGQPLLEDLFRAALDHVQQPRLAGTVTDRGEVDDDGHVGVTTAGVAPNMLIDADDVHPVEPVRILDQDPLSLGQDRRVGGVPRHPQAFGDPGDGQVLTHDAFQRPPQAPARQLGPRLRGLGGVLAPHRPAAGAAVTTDRDQQCGGAPTEGFVGQPADHRVSRCARASAPTTPPIRFAHAARQHRTAGLEALADGLKTEFVQTSEGSQVRGGEGSVGHVEVFQLGGVRTSIIGRPRPLPGQRRAQPSTPSIVKSRVTSGMTPVLQPCTTQNLVGWIKSRGESVRFRLSLAESRTLHRADLQQSL